MTYFKNSILDLSTLSTQELLFLLLLHPGASKSLKLSHLLSFMERTTHWGLCNEQDDYGNTPLQCSIHHWETAFVVACGARLFLPEQRRRLASEKVFCCDSIDECVLDFFEKETKQDYIIGAACETAPFSLFHYLFTSMTERHPLQKQSLERTCYLFREQNRCAWTSRTREAVLRQLRVQCPPLIFRMSTCFC